MKNIVVAILLMVFAVPAFAGGFSESKDIRMVVPKEQTLTKADVERVMTDVLRDYDERVNRKIGQKTKLETPKSGFALGMYDQMVSLRYSDLYGIDLEGAVLAGSGDFMRGIVKAGINFDSNESGWIKYHTGLAAFMQNNNEPAFGLYVGIERDIASFLSLAVDVYPAIIQGSNWVAGQAVIGGSFFL